MKQEMLERWANRYVAKLDELQKSKSWLGDLESETEVEED